MSLLQEVVCKHHVKVHQGGANAVTFAPSGLQAASCGQDGVVRLWDTDTGEMSTELAVSRARGAGPGVNDVCFQGEGSQVLGACSDHSVKLWDIHTGRVRHTLTGTLFCLRVCLRTGIVRG